MSVYLQWFFLIISIINTHCAVTLKKILVLISILFLALCWTELE